jgi:hypothetical protein
VDGIVHEETVTVDATRLFAPRDSVRNHPDAVYVDEDGGELSGDEVARLFGVPERTVKYVDPGPSRPTRRSARPPTG